MFVQIIGKGYAKLLTRALPLILLTTNAGNNRATDLYIGMPKLFFLIFRLVFTILKCASPKTRVVFRAVYCFVKGKIN